MVTSLTRSTESVVASGGVMIGVDHLSEGLRTTMYEARTIEEYDPIVDAAQRWPRWRFLLTCLGGIPKVICSRRRLLLIDPTGLTQEVALATAVAHLDLGHHLGAAGEFTDDQEADARGLALMRLGLDELR